MFSFRARAEKGIARHVEASSVVRTWKFLMIFDWFVMSMRMQVILDSSFARPGSAPIWGGKKGEFRDWTTESRNEQAEKSKKKRRRSQKRSDHVKAGEMRRNSTEQCHKL